MGKRHVQLSLDRARKPSGRGGWRPNAGRKRTSRNEPHLAREDFPGRFPQHVTLRVLNGLPSLRDERFVGLICTQIALAHDREFRIVQFCVEWNHLHLIAEAAGKEALAEGVRRFKSRVARRLNRDLGRKGELFDQRYHRRSLTTPREVRNALCYVLNNERHHADERGQSLPPRWFDPFSSAPWFDGWESPLAIDEPKPCPVAPAQTWLLRRGWRRHGLINLAEVPARRATAMGKRRRAKRRTRVST
jgi:REP element-mobilizing transposase RayT